jgi:polysaccharide deacetylase family protein (PEP-CTERM system associated)
MLNCLSFDIEGFVESNQQSFPVDACFIDRKKAIAEIEKNTDVILELLDVYQCKATFFCLAGVCRDLPHLVKKIAQGGHETALHGPEHRRIYGMQAGEFRFALSDAKKRMEDVVSKPIYGFRAPDFSIVKSSLWALDILREEGFLYDSSIFPYSFHDVYGIKDFKPCIHRIGNGLIEFPLSVIDVFGRPFPFGGGGYFRLYPLFLTEMCMKRLNNTGKPVMMYIHPYEIGPVIPRIPSLSPYRRFRHYFNCRSGRLRLGKLLPKFNFSTALDVLIEAKMVEVNDVRR